MTPLRVLVLMHRDLVPPESTEGMSEADIVLIRTEMDVLKGLRAMGHLVTPLGVASDLGVIEETIREWKPHLAFNVLEGFEGDKDADGHRATVGGWKVAGLPWVQG